MVTKSIRVSEETYEGLFEVAGRLQAELKRPISVDEAIRIMIRKFKPNIISDLAGCWDVSDEEIKNVKKSLADGWDRWNQSV